MIRMSVIGEDTTLASIDETYKAYLVAARNAVKKVGYRHESIIKTQKLQGQVLNRRSGRLSAGVHTVFVDDDTSSSAITGIGPELLYGKMHEEGGVFTVKEHLRMMTMAWGKPVANPREILVKEHSMTVPQRSFLRSTMREQAETDIQTVRDEVAKVKP